MATTTDMPTERPERPWTLEPAVVAEHLGVDPERGLDDEAVGRRLARFGPNRLEAHERKSAWAILLDQLKSFIVGLLAAASLLALAFGRTVEFAAVAVVLVINTVIGFVTEYRAVRSMEALRELGRVETVVRRGGERQEVPAEEIVPGDVVVVGGGDVITADARLVSFSNLEVDESALTGESVPVAKRTDPVDPDAPLAERVGMLYKGTAATRGSGEAVVVATGMDTELGHISEMVREAAEESTPLQRRLQELGRRLLWLTLAVAVAVAGLGLLSGRDVLVIVETAIALAVAAVPEGLPIVATVALARGMRRMARRNALVEKLEAVETLGSVGVVLTDKTGTLTENRMTMAVVRLPDGQVEVTGGFGVEGGFEVDGREVDPGDRPLLLEALRISALCNEAELADDPAESAGDPMEVALLLGAAKAGVHREPLLDDRPLVREEAFDPDLKMMATFHRIGEDEVWEAVKGAPSEVLDVCSAEAGGAPLDDDRRQWWIRENERMAAGGLRVLALATRTVTAEEVDPYRELRIVGLVGLVDPPRQPVRAAIEDARGAGVRVVMVTGDQSETAAYVGEAVGIGIDDVIDGRDLEPLEEMSEERRDRVRRASVLARTSPAQKLDLIELHQRSGDIVAMIGDGVNDAPALEKADIGVAMGVRGTQVAKEAADMVLGDDAFGTIVVAIRQGRVIFGNIRAFVVYLLSCNLSEILAVGLASALAVPLPVLPLQILYLNVVTDVFPALALGAGEGSPGIMDRPPRDPSEPVLTRGHWVLIGGYGILITAAVLGSLLVATQSMGLDRDRAVTMSFLTLAFAQLWHVFDMIGPDADPFRNEVTANPWVWGAIALSVLLLVVPMFVPILSEVLRIVPLRAAEWGVVLGLSLAPLVVARVAAPLVPWGEGERL